MFRRQRNSRGEYITNPRAVNQRLLKTVLKQLYYTPENPASFSSPRILYLAARKKIANLTMHDVNLWLAKQKTYALHKHTRTEFPRRKVLVPGPRYQYQADLLDMRTAYRPGKNNRTKYMLTMIDVFSRYACAVPMRAKNASDTLEALKEGFKLMSPLGFPRKLQTDNGTEFYNSVVQNYLRKNGIILFSTFQKDIKAGMVERFNRTLRKMISMYLDANETEMYIDHLSALLQGYNSRKHSAFDFKYAPIDIRNFQTVADEKQIKSVYNLLYGDYLAQRQKAFVFKIGDIVLKAFQKKGGPNAFAKMTQTYDTIKYEIIDRLAKVPPVYKIKTVSTGNIQPGTFYAQQLQKVSPDLGGMDEASDVIK